MVTLMAVADFKWMTLQLFHVIAGYITISCWSGFLCGDYNTNSSGNAFQSCA